MKQLSGLKRPGSILALVLSIALISMGLIANPLTASAATFVEQCEGVENGGGRAVVCDYDVVNNIDANGATSSSVTLNACVGAAGLAAVLTCTSSTTLSTDLVTAIEQCNGSGTGGGSRVTCSVDVTNNIVGTVTPTTATVNQCVGSGGAGTTFNCDPFPATTAGATVTQCNGSLDGGGMHEGNGLTCTVDSSSTTTGLLTVTVNQCNGSANGPGSSLTCRTSITNNIIQPPLPPPPAPAPGPTTTAGPPATPGPTPIPTVTPSPSVAPVVPTPTPIPPRGGGSGGPDGPGGDGGGNNNGSGNGDNGSGKGGNGGGDDNGSFGSAGAGAGGGTTGSGSGITSQVTSIPRGGAAAGGGSTSGIESPWLLLLGLALMVVAIPTLVSTRPIKIKV